MISTHERYSRSLGETPTEPCKFRYATEYIDYYKKESQKEPTLTPLQKFMHNNVNN